MKACIKKNYKNKFEGKNSLMSFAFDFDELGIRQRKKCSSKSLYIADEVIAGIEEIASMTNSSFNNVATSMLETQLKILQQRYKKPQKRISLPINGARPAMPGGPLKNRLAT